MGQNIDYATVSSSVAAMKEIANSIEACKRSMSYYYYGSIDTEGEFASSFEHMKAMIQKTVGDIEAYIDTYATVIDYVAQNFDILDNEMKSYLYRDYMV